MSGRYVLEGKEVVPCEDLLKWARWMEEDVRTVEYNTIGGSRVSTVFLGLDHQFGKGLPLLFETLVFDGKLDGEMDRYSTWDEAVAGHKAMVERVKEAMRG